MVARKGRATFEVVVEGRGAHAGGQHGRGANAIVELARPHMVIIKAKPKATKAA